MANELTVIGSLAGGVDLGDVDLIYPGDTNSRFTGRKAGKPAAATGYSPGVTRFADTAPYRIARSLTSIT